jgi:hypothetical protein
MDFENIKISVDDKAVHGISAKCNELTDLLREVESKENELLILQKKAKDLQERVIPDLMHQAGVDSIDLRDGSRVEVKPAYYAKIPTEREQEAFDWLRQKGKDSLIKNTVTASFDKGQDNLVSQLIQVCEENGFNYNKKQKIEPMTLKGFVREQIEDGKEIPMDLFGVYIANKTKITKK